MNLHVLTEAWTEALPEAWDYNQSEARSGYTSLPPFVWRKEGNSSHIGQTRLETGLTKIEEHAIEYSSFKKKILIQVSGQLSGHLSGHVSVHLSGHMSVHLSGHVS